MHLLRTLLIFAIWAMFAAILFGFLGFIHPAFDTFSHFRLHFAAGLLGAAMAALALAQRRIAVVATIIATAGIASAWQGLPLPVAGAAAKGSVHRLLFFNLRFDNRDQQAVLAMIGAQAPDILLLTEYSGRWVGPLEALAGNYPYRFHCTEWRHVGGTMMLSKIPMEAEPRYCHNYAAMGLVRMKIDGVPVTIGSVHLRWPWPASGPRQVEAMAPALAGIGANALVAGDFNAVTWSHTLRRFAQYGGLTIVAGIGPTWMLDLFPASLARFGGLPIDNVLSRGAVEVLSARALPPAGSDHLPVLVEFSIDASDCCRAAPGGS